MALALFAWLTVVLHGPRSHRQGSSLNSAAPKSPRIVGQCVFCQAFTSNRGAFDIVWEDADFLAFRDHQPACLHHIQLIPKFHISSVRNLTSRDVDMIRRMESIGNDILDKYKVPQTHRKMGFHIPPFNTVQHLHLHVQALPYTSFVVQFKYPVARGFGALNKGFSWFVEVAQTIRILDKGSTVGVLPC
ncbi:HIT-like domain-containing protein [Boletus edulis BED1]|uniref:HIT-like domain-containing protein n=1 Tax=Boletus edulis BED1 TaxID=1328754 RepID=A0AAD4BX73_BOLED|nr:HIT-like domain-containing protein [Boletus edulis BED1]